MDSARGQIITFYSYKGGTGRTMALANAGTLLARKGSNVLLMDWDLEAPGLHRYFAEQASASFDEQAGTIDLLEELAALVPIVASAGTVDDTPGLDEDDTLALVRKLALDRFVHPVNASLSLVWAGASDSEDYSRRVSEFDWSGLYKRAPYLFPCLATVLAERFGYVCVDARTGISDTSGVCTAMLPEKLVVVFTPNRQSLDGALSRSRAAVSYRRQSADLRPLVVYPLASRVELSEDELRLRWRHGGGEYEQDGYQARFERLFRDIYALPECDLQAWFDEVQIQQTTRYAYGEEVAVANEEATTDRLSLAHSYVRFTEALEDADGPWNLRRRKGSAANSDESAQEELAMKRLREELEWHEGRSRRRRNLLLMIRLYQAVTVAGAVVAAFVLSVSYYSTWFWGSLVAGAALATGEELVAVVSGATQWSVNAKIARRLADEEYRFQAHTRQYEADGNHGKLLAERVEDILSETYEEWERTSQRFGSLAPTPRRPPRWERSEDGRAR